MNIIKNILLYAVIPCFILKSTSDSKQCNVLLDSFNIVRIIKIHITSPIVKYIKCHLTSNISTINLSISMGIIINLLSTFHFL